MDVLKRSHRLMQYLKLICLAIKSLKGLLPQRWKKSFSIFFLIHRKRTDNLPIKDLSDFSVCSVYVIRQIHTGNINNR